MEILDLRKMKTDNGKFLPVMPARMKHLFFNVTNAKSDCHCRTPMKIIKIQGRKITMTKLVKSYNQSQQEIKHRGGTVLYYAFAFCDRIGHSLLQL